MNYLHTEAEAAHAEESIPSMSYRTLVENLGRLTELGVVAPENPATMLVAARLLDRSRIQRSGVSAGELHSALENYRRRPDAVAGIVKALERAATLAVRGKSAAAE